MAEQLAPSLYLFCKKVEETILRRTIDLKIEILKKNPIAYSMLFVGRKDSLLKGMKKSI